MITATLLTCLLCYNAGYSDQEPEPKLEKGFVRLFDGKTLEGWEGDPKTFQVREGAIVGGSLKKRVPHNEFLCTQKTYGDFELRLQAKLVGKGGNAGIQIRTRRIPNHHEVIGYQCDMGVVREDLIWGALYDESRRRRFLAQADPAKVRKNFKADDWNEFIIRCQGDRIQIWLNGFQTVNYREKEKDIARRGVIALQIHGGPPSEAWYRNIRIKEL